MPHGADLLRCLERGRSAQNTEESTPCTLSTKIEPDSRGTSPGMTNFAVVAYFIGCFFESDTQDDVRSAERGSLSAGVEEVRQPRLKMLGDFLGGAIFGVADGAGAGKSLVAAGNIVGDPRESIAAHHDLAGGNFDRGEIA